MSDEHVIDMMPELREEALGSDKFIVTDDGAVMLKEGVEHGELSVDHE